MNNSDLAANGNGWKDSWWISPNGEQIPVVDDHIADVFENPKKFGMNPDELKHEKFSDPSGELEILDVLLKRGWIKFHFSNLAVGKRLMQVQVFKWGNKFRGNLWGLLNSKYRNCDPNIKITIYQNTTNDIIGTLGEFLDYSNDVFESIVVNLLSNQNVR